MSSITGIEGRPALHKYEPEEPSREDNNTNELMPNNIDSSMKMTDIIEYLNSKQTKIGSHRKKLVNRIYKSLLDNFLPSYMKLIVSEQSKESEAEV